MDLRLENITKSFGVNRAVDDASLDIRAGQVLALLGENGAGKSTLMKLLYGVHQPDAGRILLDGRPVSFRSSRAALAAGIGMVFQQFSLLPALSVRENLVLALPRSPWWLGRGASRLSGLDDRLHAIASGLDAGALVADLPVGQMQLVEIAKALVSDARCLILDEPSAVLAPAEAQRLWQLVRTLAGQGFAIVLITHKLGDVRAAADEVAVMRAGRVVAQAPAQGASDAQIVRWMVGEAPAPVRGPDSPGLHALPRLVLRDLTAASDAVAEAVHGVSVEVKVGEILGVAGVSGSGQVALAEAIAGERPLNAGEVILEGELLRAPRLAPRVEPRLGFIPPEPLVNAVAPGLSLAVNLAIKRLDALPRFPSHARMADDARSLIARFGVRPCDPWATAGQLSGGNLQKLVAARELSGDPLAVVACYPTMGLDVTATAQVYASLFGLAERGTAVLWISEDLDDLLRFAHRIAVLHAGRLVAVVDARQTDAAQLGSWMTGHADAQHRTTDAPAAREAEGCAV